MLGVPQNPDPPSVSCGEGRPHEEIDARPGILCLRLIDISTDILLHEGRLTHIDRRWVRLHLRLNSQRT